MICYTLILEKGIRGRMHHAIHQFAKESPYLKHWEANNLYGWTTLQKLSVNNFTWIEDTSRFNEDFIKGIMKKVMKDIFPKLLFNILKNYMNFIMIYHFNWKESKLKTEYVVHIKNSKLALNHGLNLENFIELLNLKKRCG